MHAQTESAPEHRAHAAANLQLASGLGLYLLTLAGEAMLGGPVRWLLTYLGASALGVLLPLGPGAERLAWIAALALLRSADPSLPGPSRCYVLDEPLPEAAVRGHRAAQLR